jgi:hypothetical protein
MCPYLSSAFIQFWMNSLVPWDLVRIQWIDESIERGLVNYIHIL